MNLVAQSVIDGWDCAAHGDDDACAWSAVTMFTEGEASAASNALRAQAESLAAGAARNEATGAEAVGSPGNCFLAGTQVLMTDESTKKIEDIQVGEEVVATDPQTGKTAKCKVADVGLTQTLLAHRSRFEEQGRSGRHDQSN
ncbi:MULTISPECIES: Hint domain-containing homing endonuclease [unclassified Streptomyces]|uniref:Hint domain-containing homing endonuclease n=1 Tax=unclassified Streptomyces TaxID=2593676 RepID=UPI0037FA697F